MASRLAYRCDSGSVDAIIIGRGIVKYFAGLDVTLQETAIFIVDEDGIVVREGKAISDPDDLVCWLTATDLTLARLGLEAGPLSPWLHAGLRAAGLPAICVETRRMKGATAAMAVKTDRNDARAIAHAMRVGWFTIVHVKSAESLELRLLLSNRRTLLYKRGAIDNEIRGTLKAFGIKLGAVGVAGFAARVIELLGDRPRLLSMVQPMLQAREALPADAFSDPEAIAAMLRVAAGNFRLVIRLITQSVRIQEINGLERITSEVVAAARESLVIGTD